MSSRCLIRFMLASRQGALCLNRSLHIQRTLSLLSNKSFPSPQCLHNQTRNLCASQKNSTEKCELFNIQDTEDFQKRVLESSTPVIVDFHATWCGPCKLLGPRLESIISQKGGRVALAKIDVDDNADLAMQHAVVSVPTVIAFKNGKVFNKFIGLVDDDVIDSFVEKAIN